MTFHAWDEYRDYVGLVEFGYIFDEDKGTKDYVADIVTPMGNVIRKNISEEMFDYLRDFEPGFGCRLKEYPLSMNFHTGNINLMYYIRVE